MIGKKVKAAAIRAMWAAMQTMLSMIVVGQTIYDIDWKYVAGSVALASIISFLKSMLLGMPEVNNVEGDL